MTDYTDLYHVLLSTCSPPHLNVPTYILSLVLTLLGSIQGHEWRYFSKRVHNTLQQTISLSLDSIQCLTSLG